MHQAKDATKRRPNAGEIDGEQRAAAVKRVCQREPCFWIKTKEKLLDDKHEELLKKKRAATSPADLIL